MDPRDPPGTEPDPPYAADEQPATGQEAATPADGATMRSIKRRARGARRVVGAIKSSAEAAAEPFVERVTQAIGDAEQLWHERPGARVRRVRRLGLKPLPYLMDVHPGARLARPVQVGLRSIDVDEIAGTAVGGGEQRGGDFLPLKQFRGANWRGRWQRLRSAHERLADLPPIDVVKHRDRYWVVDGHNRVGLAKYGGQVAIDANIVELVPPGERRTEPIVSLAPSAADSRTLRAAGSGQRAGDSIVADGVLHSHELAGAPEESE
jgi:hypothetical protein